MTTAFETGKGSPRFNNPYGQPTPGSKDDEIIFSSSTQQINNKIGNINGGLVFGCTFVLGGAAGIVGAYLHNLPDLMIVAGVVAGVGLAILGVALCTSDPE